MAKKQEDNRDVFEKALDYVVPVAGAYLGARAGMRLGASKKSVSASYKDADAARERVRSDGSGLDEYRSKNNAAWRRGDRRIHGGMAGATAGAVGGMILQDGNRPGKRRK